MTISLWGSISSLPTENTPLSILKEQAEYLTRETNGILRGEVVNDKESYEDDFSYDLRIRAPHLNDYRITIINISHPLELYPLKLHARGDIQFTCNNETEFLSNLKTCLSSEQILRVVSSLLAQSKAL